MSQQREVDRKLEALRKVDIAHSGQTVAEALEQLVAVIKHARRDGEDAVLVVHGFGASGVGGAIKNAVATELPRLSRLYGFRAFLSDSDRIRIPRDLNFDARRLNQGTSLLVFRKAPADKEPMRAFRPNFRNMKRVKVPNPAATAGQRSGSCRHADRQLLSRGPTGSTYKCRACGTTFLIYA